MTARLSPTRRTMMLGGFCLCCTPALPRASAADDAFATEEIAAGIHIRRGLDEDASPSNADAIANIGFIIGRDGVLVTDAGGSLADGRRLRAAIRQKTQLPIKYVVLSHVHPDHIFGAGAFLGDEPQFVGHARLAREIAARGDYYRKALIELYGAEGAGPVVMPKLEVEAEEKLDLGDRAIIATAHKTAHTTCDLSLFDSQTGTLLPADLLFVKRVPSLDGSLTGWLGELARLKQRPAARAVPGHGPVAVAWPGGATDLERYLQVLAQETRHAIDAGVGLADATGSIAQSERRNWLLFDAYNGRNVTEAYKELEWQ